MVMVDRSAVLVELLTTRLDEHGHATIGYSEPEAAIDYARSSTGKPPQAILASLAFPSSQHNGLDVILAFTKFCPETAIILYVDQSVDELALLQVAWDAVHPASAVSRRSEVSTLIETIQTVLTYGRAEPDPRLQHLIPLQRSTWRTQSGYAQLVPHAGHAKLWGALLELEQPPSYRSVAETTGLSINTLKNYRDDLRGELKRHGLSNPTLQEMHRFAHLVRPLLDPVIRQRIAS